MKKLKYILAALFILLGFNNNIDAKEIKATDIPNSTYVIGEHMFTREINEENLYKGQLTTEFIMVTAKSIAGDKINDMIIYQKTARGKWINALTNKEVNPPESFDIIFKNFSRLVPIKYGDANGDGKINVSDVLMIERYLAGWPDKDIIRSNCDVNGDTKITAEDVFFLRRIIVGDYPESNIPNEPLGKTHYIEFANPSGHVYKRTFELHNHFLFDIDYKPEEESKIFEGWYTDKELTQKYDVDSLVTTNLTLYAKFGPIRYGDVNGDGMISPRDATYLMRYLAGRSDTKVIKENADVNGDGMISEQDVFFLLRVISDYYKEADLPNKPLSPTYTILFNLSENELYKTSYEMHGYKLFYSENIENPKKEGYIFEGWYTDVELTQKYDVDAPVTSNLTLYAKFKPVKYGDVNEDGRISPRDATYLMRYLAGRSDTKVIKENADVNGDGMISEQDVFFLLRVISDYYKEADLPNKPLSPTYTILFNLSENELYKTSYEMHGYKLFYSEKVENPKKAGQVFEGWYTDVELTQKYDLNEPVTTNLTLYAKFGPIKYGDTNGDKKIDQKDITYLEKYLNGYQMESEFALENCDINNDGKINNMDLVMLKKTLQHTYQNVNLPNEPLGNVYVIEYNYDGQKTIDYELENNEIKSILKPSKNGYKFVGWFTDNEYQNTYNEQEKITENKILYGKFEIIE